MANFDFIIQPDNVTLKEYQEKAISNWLLHDNRGYFDMCTGSGKTYTALGAINSLAQSLNNNLAVFIVCPYKHLVGQWEEDLEKWNISPIVCHSESNDKDWQSHLMNAYKRFRQFGKPFLCISTNVTFCKDKIQEIVSNISNDMNVLFVADEAHNWGAVQLSNMLPRNIKYRLGLSATIERFNDEHGTDTLLDYFGPRCITYSIEEGIKSGESLCSYDYYPILVSLTKNELFKYQDLTRKIQKSLIVKDGKTELTQKGKLLVYERSRLLAGAEEKIIKLKELIEPCKNEKGILVYCGATTVVNDDGGQERLINDITRMLNEEIGIVAHKFTAEEDIKERIKLKELFADGFYQALTAIKCLDEGVNIPCIQKAFIMSSTRNPKEFVQRRGRLLRKSHGKDKAIIYDFVILPRPLNEVRYGDIENDKNIVYGELARVYEFGRLALNEHETQKFIADIEYAYNISFERDDYAEMYEEVCEDEY